jgi:GT2 family glycosyltransferase
MKKQISIVMAHYNRFHLLYNTLTSIYKKHNHTNIQVIVVDDGSTLLEGKEKIFEFPITYVQLPQNKWYVNPCIPYNVGIEYSENDIVIIQNPECYHFDDVIFHTLSNLNDNDYFAYSCYSLPEKKSCYDIKTPQDFQQRSAHHDGDDGWYAHSKYRPVHYHFCASTKRSNLKKIDNFSREYAYGIGYDDNDLVYKLTKAKLNLKLIDNVSVLHQFHYFGNKTSAQSEELCRKNENIYFNKIRGL